MCSPNDKGICHYPLFVASFMNVIDPRPDMKDDLSIMDNVIWMFGDGKNAFPGRSE